MADREEQVADESLDILRSRISAANQRAANAEERVQTVEVERDRTMLHRVAADETAAINAIAAATAELDAAKKEVVVAGESGAWGKMADAQQRVAEATNNLASFKNQHAKIVNWKRNNITPEGQIRRKEQPSPTPEEQDPLGEYTPETANWLRKHPELLQKSAEGQRLFTKAMAAHYNALDAGISADTEPYFRFIDEKMGYSSPLSQAADTVEVELDREDRQNGREERQNAQNGRERRDTPSATGLPPSRGNGAGGSTPLRADRMRLTLEEQEIARKSWPHLKPQEAYNEYAENKSVLISEGRLPS